MANKEVNREQQNILSYLRYFNTTEQEKSDRKEKGGDSYLKKEKTPQEKQDL